MTVRNKIKQFLDRRGITRYQFRKETGIAQRTAYDLYDNPEQIPSGSVLEKICDAYEIQPGELLEWVPKSGSGGKGGQDTIATEPAAEAKFGIGDCIRSPGGERGYVSGFDGGRVLVDMDITGSDSYPPHLLKLVHRAPEVA